MSKRLMNRRLRRAIAKGRAERAVTAIDAKIEAREWILAAIQRHSCIPGELAEQEVRWFIQRLQRDIESLKETRDFRVIANEAGSRERERYLQAQDLKLRFEHAIAKGQ